MAKLFMTIKKQYFDEILSGKKKDPHEVSKVKCDLCDKEWIAVRPEGLTELECPNCENMVQFENV